MKHKRFSDEQVIGVLKEHEAGAKVDDICRRTRSARRRSTLGGRSTVAWRRATRSDCASSRRRTRSSSGSSRTRCWICHISDEGTARKTLVSPWPGDEPWAS